jgi:hypothetical protein
LNTPTAFVSQQGAVRALDEHGLARPHRRVHNRHDLADVRRQPLGVAQVLPRHHLDVPARVGLQVRADGALALDQERQLRAEASGVSQVARAQSHSRHFVHVAGADAAAGGPNRLATAPRLLGPIQQQVEGQHQVGALAHQQPVRAHAARVQHAQLLQQNRGVQGHAAADHAGRVGVEDARGHQVQREAPLGVDDRVAGVVAALRPNGYLGARRQQVDDLPLALVAPLPAHDGNNWHALPSPNDSV